MAKPFLLLSEEEHHDLLESNVRFVFEVRNIPLFYQKQKHRFGWSKKLFEVVLNTIYHSPEGAPCPFRRRHLPRTPGAGESLMFYI
jgi:hypothetical protein